LKSVATSTIARELGLVQHIFEFAKNEWGIPVTNPIKAIKKLKAPKPRDRRLNAGELDALLEASKRSRNRYLSPIFRLAIATGMRRGEIVRLKWSDIHWEDCTLHIPITKTDVPRTIPLSKGICR
jgi:integrase